MSCGRVPLGAKTNLQLDPVSRRTHLRGVIRMEPVQELDESRFDEVITLQAVRTTLKHCQTIINTFRRFEH
jgi:hypothetical protein